MRGFPTQHVARGLFAGLLLLGGSLLHAAPPRSAPTRATRSTSGVYVEIRGIEYISAAEVARRSNLRGAWAQPNKRFVLTGEGQRIEFEVDSRESEVNGLRVVLGEAARVYKRSLYISRIDAERYIEPMIGRYGRNPVPRTRVIVLDPGHGGRDTGKMNERLKLMEKTFTLDVAVRLKKLLEARGFKVVLTRSDDRFLELPDRPAVAQRVGGDVFVSLHFNSVETGANRVTGLEVYTMTPQYQYSTSDSRREDREEARLFNPGNVNDVWNSVLAYKLQKQLLADLKVPDRGIKRSRYAVLRLAPCPAVLVEGGYLSHDGEARKIATPAYRQALAESLAKGLRAYAAALDEARK